VIASHIRAVLSADAVTMRLPSTLNAALRTMSSCPRRRATCAPVIASHIRAVLSADARNDAPSINAECGAENLVFVSAEKGGLSARAHVPYSRRSVFGGGDNAFAIGTERGTVDCAVVSAKDYDLGVQYAHPRSVLFCPAMR